MSREDGRDTAEAPLVHRFASSRRDVGANLCTSTGGARTSILPVVTCRLCVAAGSARNFERGELAPASAPTGITVTLKPGLGFYLKLPLIWKGDIGLNEQEATELHDALGSALASASASPCPRCGK